MNLLKHYRHLSDDEKQVIFDIEPSSFNKHTERETLGYALGATLYMPAYQNIAPKILNKELPELTSFVMDFEDAVREEDLDMAQAKAKETLRTLYHEIEMGNLDADDLPLLFLRVRNKEQFERFAETLTKEEATILTGFNFPKFHSGSGGKYLQITKDLGNLHKTPLYGMPILETPKIIHQETRLEELLTLKGILFANRENVLNIRVGGTDFSSLFALRRGIDHTIYDVMVVADVLRDIQNLLMRAEDGFVISAPVWEYFANNRMLKPRIRMTPFMEKKMLSKRTNMIDKAIDGLIQELIKDKANGFVGKTIIHPSHISYVNAFQAITSEEYEDAMMILNGGNGGVLKSANGNKMNEINPHMAWAKKILKKAHVYGVIKESDDLVNLF